MSALYLETTGRGHEIVAISEVSLHEQWNRESHEAAQDFVRGRMALLLAMFGVYAVRAATAASAGSMTRSEMWTARAVRVQQRHAALVARVAERGAL